MMKKKSVRNSLRSSASILGLAAGAVGWSSVARAESEDSQVQTLLLPEHYHQSNDGLVTFKLQTGEQLTLNPDQYVILQDGLLLITDELAQASMQSLPVMGSIRAQLTSELQPVRSPNGSVVQASDASPLWSGDGPAPRLFEEVDIQRFELAQNSSETQTQSEANLGQAAGAAAGGLSLAGLSLLSSIPGTKKSEQSTEEEESPAPTLDPEFLSNTAYQALTPANARVFTGSAADSYIGYSSASTSTPDPLNLPGFGAGNSATFNMSAGGDNYLLAGTNAGGYTGTFSYTGGSGSDVLTFGDAFAFGGLATLDLGSDTAADPVTFQGTIGEYGSVTIKNFNYNHDTIDVPAGVSAVSGEIADAGGNLTWTDSGGYHTIVFEGIGTGGPGVVATTAQLIADII